MVEQYENLLKKSNFFQINQYCEQLKVNSEELGQLMSNQNGLYTCIVICNADKLDRKNLKQALNFLNSFSELQAQSNMQGFNKFLTRCYTYMYTQPVNLKKKAIFYFNNCRKKLQTLDMGLTLADVIFVKICIAAQFHSYALSCINRPILKLEKSSCIDQIDLYNFLYYSGCVYLALKMYDQAKFSFNQLIDSQLNLINEVAIEAKRKLILLYLRENKNLNQIQQLTKIDQDILTQDINMFHYVQLNKINDQQKFDEVITGFMEIYQKHGNMGLVRQTRNIVCLKKVQQMKQLFIRITLKKFITELDIKEHLVVETINSLNLIQNILRFNQKENVIEFVQSDQMDYNETVLKPLSKNFTDLKALKTKYEQDHRRLLLNYEKK